MNGGRQQDIVADQLGECGHWGEDGEEWAEDGWLKVNEKREVMFVEKN